MRARRTAVVALFVLVAGTLSAGVAAAVSGGGYDPAQQDCSPMADNHDFQGTEPGCHNFKLNVEDSQGNRYAQAGIAQEAQNDNPHAGDVSVTPNGTAGGPSAGGSFDTRYQPFPPGDCGLFDLAIFPIELLFNTLGGNPQGPCKLDPPAQPSGPPTVTPSVQAGTPDGSVANVAQGGRVYLGADDNLDSGEHDGVNGGYGTHNSANGPSDGGAIIVDWHPAQIAEWLATLTAAPGAPGPFLSNPVPLVSAGFGACADGVCLGIYSAKTTVYQGGTSGERDVYNYSGKNWDPAACSSGSDSDEQQCHGPNPGDPQTMDQYRKAEKQNVVAQPGVQVYEDPDAEGSPIGPYPLPAAYAGTCGVAVGGGDMDLSGTPVSNSAGQAVVSTGC
ncbi:MAG: hypothetical protein JWP02_2660 [Acidimicrobiales bacterium]|nr:hypothetical protein [Acidimicrobiales bacterium]